MDSRGEGHVRRAASVPRAGGDTERVLRLDAPAAEPAGAGQRPAAGTHPGHPCRQPGHLWEPACPRAAHARGLCGGAGACRATVAGHGARGPARETRPAHHRQHARPARRPQRARASLRGRPSKPAVDHRHHLHLDVGGLAVSGGRARPVRAPRRRVGRAAAPADGAGPGGAAAGAGATRARPRSWCTIPIGAASMPPRLISVCCASMGSSVR